MPEKEVTITAEFIGKTATPTFSPASGTTFTNTLNVTVSCATNGAMIYYTKDGSAPTTSSMKYTGTISVSETSTIKAIAVKDGMADSAVAEASYSKTSASGGESAVVTKAPTANTLAYTGSAQELVTAGTATGGEMRYALGNETEATQPYTTSIPTGTNAGTYYVWYKAVGDASHLDSAAASVTVTISAAAAQNTTNNTETSTENTSTENTSKESTSTENTSTESTSTESTSTESTSTDSEDDNENDTEYYSEVSIYTGEVKDITRTTEATRETNPYSTVIVNSNNLESLLNVTAEEKAAGVNVWLDVKDASTTVPAADKTAIQSAARGYTVGLYLDISLFKKVGSGNPAKVTDTNGKVKVSIVIPENLRTAGRTFEVIRVHNGVSTVIQGTYDAANHTFTFETDQFSSYAIAYKDSTTSPKTGDTLHGYSFWLLIMAAGIAVSAGAFIRKKKAD